MIIRTISFGLTHNIGNYESARLDMQAQLEDWEDYAESFRHLKMTVADQIGLTYNDIISISEHDLELSEELKNLLATVRDKRSEVESLKREILGLNIEVQRLINFKQLVEAMKTQMETITKGTDNFYCYMGSTLENLSEAATIWNRLISPAVEEEEEEEEYDPIPFDGGDCNSNSLIPYSEF